MQGCDGLGSYEHGQARHEYPPPPPPSIPLYQIAGSSGKRRAANREKNIGLAYGLNVILQVTVFTGNSDPYTLSTHQMVAMYWSNGGSRTPLSPPPGPARTGGRWPPHGGTKPVDSGTVLIFTVARFGLAVSLVVLVAVKQHLRVPCPPQTPLCWRVFNMSWRLWVCRCWPLVARKSRPEKVRATVVAT